MNALRIVGVTLSALLLLLLVTLAALVGLNAECNGADCPHSASYRYTIALGPIATFVLLAGGAGWSIVRRSVWPLVLAEAVSLAVVAVLDASNDSLGLGNVALLAVAAVGGRAATRRMRGGPHES